MRQGLDCLMLQVFSREEATGRIQNHALTPCFDRAGIPYFVSEFEENMTSYDHLEIQLQTFVENLLFR